jgi:hypothetical protein
MPCAPRRCAGRAAFARGTGHLSPSSRAAACHQRRNATDSACPLTVRAGLTGATANVGSRALCLPPCGGTLFHIASPSASQHSIVRSSSAQHANSASWPCAWISWLAARQISRSVGVAMPAGPQVDAPTRGVGTQQTRGGPSKLPVLQPRQDTQLAMLLPFVVLGVENNAWVGG